MTNKEIAKSNLNKRNEIRIVGGGENAEKHVQDGVAEMSIEMTVQNSMYSFVQQA